MTFKIYNSLTKSKETFIPTDENHIKIYACGPTVYNHAHIGNARMSVVFDILVRLLKFTYPKVTYISNITDVDDKIIAAAKRENVPFQQIAEKYTDLYNADMKKLNIQKPDIQPKATDHIADMIKLIKTLISKGYAYQNENHVCFDVSKYKHYGCLSSREMDDQISGIRVKVATYKKNALDFVLWKPSKKNEPGWDSPWGHGRPGWHIECSAMVESFFKLPIDIHGGGLDLKFPHHENEIAQSCCANSYENNPEMFAKYWVHNGFVNIDDKKMSKSLGNIFLVNELNQKYPGEVIRVALISSHYRQPLNWTDLIIDQAKTLCNKFYRILHEHKEINYLKNEPIPIEFISALNDDLNISKYFTHLSHLFNELKKEKEIKKKIKIKSQIMNAGALIGILEEDPGEWLSHEKKDIKISEEEILQLIEDRNSARKEKNFIKADEIRDKLKLNNILLKDSNNQTTWYYESN